MSRLSIIVFIILLILAQAIISSLFPLFAGVPNLFVIAVVWLSVKAPGRAALAAAIAGGIYFDLFGGIFFGTGLASFLVLYAALKFSLEWFLPREGYWLQLLGLILAGLLAWNISVWLLNSAAGQIFGFSTPGAGRFFSQGFFWSLLYSLLVCFPLSGLAKKMGAERI